MSQIQIQTIVYDSISGEIQSDRTFTPVSKNGGGFVISYTAKMCEFLESYSTGAVVRLFLYIAHHQNYGSDGVYGFRCSREYLCKVLGLTRKTVWSALMLLKKNFLLNELRINGSLEFMVNPDYVTIGSDKRDRKREWSERWALYNKKQQRRGLDV